MSFSRFLSVAIPTLLWLCACGNKAVSTDSHNSAEVVRAPFDADSAFEYVARQTQMGPRIPATQPHSVCAEWIVSELRRHGADSVIVSRSPVRLPDGSEVVAVNILGRFVGSATTPRRILLAAHYDTRPHADNDPRPENRTRPADGANDGASGVAVLLETARQLGSSRPEVSVDLLFTDVEDSGEEGDNSSWCLGTQRWIEDMPYAFTDDDPAPIFGILLDMVGGRDAQFPTEYYSAEMAPAAVARIRRTARALGLTSRFPDKQGGAVVDDHLWLSKAGIPTADIIESRNIQTGTFPPTWHTLDDNIANIDRQTLSDVGILVNTIIRNENSRQ